MAMEWKREEDMIAEKFRKEEIPGFLTKEFVAKENEFVVVERKGEIYRERGPGKFKMSGFVDDTTDLLLLDKSENVLEREIKNVWLPDEKKIDIKFVIKFRIFHSDRFSKNLLGERKKLFLDNIWDETLSKVMYNFVLPKLKKNSAGRFLNEDFRKNSRIDVENKVKKKFSEWGLVVTSFLMDFKVPEGVTEEAGKTEHAENEEVREEPQVSPVVKKEERPQPVEPQEVKAPEPQESPRQEQETPPPEAKEPDREHLERELEKMKVLKEKVERKIAEIESKLESK